MRAAIVVALSVGLLAPGTAAASLPQPAARTTTPISVTMDADDAADAASEHASEPVAPVTDDAEPVAPDVEVVALDDAVAVAPAGEPPPASGAEISGSGGPTEATMWAPTPDLAVVGLSWELGSAPADLAVTWRSLDGGEWTAWEELHVELADAPDDPDAAVGMRDGAVPLAVVDASEIEVLMVSPSGELPNETTLAVVDPGTATADTAATMATTSGTARPTIYSRAQWGADESLMTWTPSQGRVQGIDIHHTVNSNDYTSAQVPAIIRGIYAYHAQDWGRGWGDIGYNFLVDKFGRVWEGRYGGVDAAPIGAHATGLNSNMSGISLIGNYETAAVPAAAFTAVARVAAWKLWMHGITSPYGTIRLDAGTFNRVSGHRDAAQTTCPGRYMYNRLPEMRSRIAAYIGSFGERVLDRDLDGDGYPDLLRYSGGQVGRMSTVDQGTWYRTALNTGFGPDRTFDGGDFTGDGRRDVIRLRSGGTLVVYPGSSTNRLGSARWLATGWRTTDLVVGGADLTGDGRHDILARRTNGTLWLYPNVGGTSLGRPIQFGTSSGWDAMDRITLAPDYLDGRTVVLGENRNGSLYGYRLTASGRYASRFVVSSSWSSMRLTTGVGDVTGDGNGDLVAIDSSGAMWTLPGSGAGGVYTSRKEPLDTGQRQVTNILPIGYASNKLSMWTIGSTQTLVVNRFSITVRAYSTIVRTGIAMATTDRPVVVGDWNGDGRVDIVVVKTSGDVRLYLGRGEGRFSTTSTRMTTDFDRWEGIVGAGNWRGDRETGLLTWDSQTARIWYYPSDGTRMGERILVSAGAGGMDRLVNAGQWKGNVVLDLLMRGADSKRLFFYEGNGPGLAFAPAAVTGAWTSATSILGVADVSFDGRADLLYVTTSGAVMIARGDGTGTVAATYRVASWGSAYKVW